MEPGLGAEGACWGSKVVVVQPSWPGQAFTIQPWQGRPDSDLIKDGIAWPVPLLLA